MNLKEFLLSSKLALFLRVILGALWIYGGVVKILDPYGFTSILRDYQLFPEFSIGILAIIVPWIEVITGLFLLLGLYTKLAAIAFIIQNLFFIGAMSIVLAQGRTLVNCGCFSTRGEEPLSIWSIVRDFLFIIMAIQIILSRGYFLSLDEYLEENKGKK